MVRQVLPRFLPKVYPGFYPWFYIGFYPGFYPGCYQGVTLTAKLVRECEIPTLARGRRTSMVTPCRQRAYPPWPGMRMGRCGPSALGDYAHCCCAGDCQWGHISITARNGAGGTGRHILARFSSLLVFRTLYFRCSEHACNHVIILLGFHFRTAPDHRVRVSSIRGVGGQSPYIYIPFPNIVYRESAFQSVVKLCFGGATCYCV